MYQPDPDSNAVNRKLGSVEGPSRAAMGALLVNLWASLRINGETTGSLAEASEHDLVRNLDEASVQPSRMPPTWEGGLSHPWDGLFTSELSAEQEGSLLDSLRDGDVTRFCAAFRRTCSQIDLGPGQAFTVCIPADGSDTYAQFHADFRNLDYDMSLLGCLDDVSVGGIWHASTAATALQRLGLVPNASYDDPTGYRMFDAPLPHRRSILEVHGDEAPRYTPPGQFPSTQDIPPSELAEADQRSVWWLANLLDTAGVAGGQVLFQC